VEDELREEFAFKRGLHFSRRARKKPMERREEVEEEEEGGARVH